MNKKTTWAALAAIAMVPSMVPAAASAQSQDDRRYEDRRNDDRRADERRNDDRTYRASDGRYYPCNRTNGTTGTVVGGVGGAVAGNALGGGLLGTVAGGVGGALLGRHIDKKRTAAKNRDHNC